MTETNHSVSVSESVSESVSVSASVSASVNHFLFQMKNNFLHTVK